jgi:putative transcriptional regulator
MHELQNNRLLIAEPFLKDDHFSRSVIYLLNYDDEGSFGLMLNKPFDYCLHELVNDIDQHDIKVQVGGPVELDTIHFLHQYPDLIPDAQQVSEHLFWGGDFETVKKMIRTKKLDRNKIKFFIGYSGWSKGQLENEMKEKTWLIGSPDVNIIFNTQTDQIWKSAVRSLGRSYAEMIHYPIDPQLN